jgi:hypothetical protein
MPIDSSIREFLILIFLAMVSIFYFNGCTAKALQIAKHQASPQNEEHWKIKSVVSAAKQENGDISVCVELSESGEPGKPKLDTIILPLSVLSGDTDAIDRLSLRPSECFFGNAACYWYPIEKTQNGCEPVSPSTSSSTSVLPIENINLNNKNRHQLLNLLINFNKIQPIKERIYEVSFVFGEEDTKIETDTDNDESMDNSSKGSKDIALVYWPAQIGQQDMQSIILTGVYDDNSTDLYYLMVPVAFVGDVVAFTAAAVALAFLNCPQCFEALNY